MNGWVSMEAFGAPFVYSTVHFWQLMKGRFTREEWISKTCDKVKREIADHFGCWIATGRMNGCKRLFLACGTDRCLGFQLRNQTIHVEAAKVIECRLGEWVQSHRNASDVIGFGAVIGNPENVNRRLRAGNGKVAG